MPLPETLSVKNISFGPSAFHLSQAKNQLLPARRGRMAHHGWLEDPAHAKKACLFCWADRLEKNSHPLHKFFYRNMLARLY